MRTWLHQTLINDPDVQDWLGDGPEDRVFPRFTKSTSVITKPFIIHGLGNRSEILASEDEGFGDRQYIQVWLHDEGADYTKIDDGLEIVKAALVNGSDKPSNLTTVQWLETSQEFNNETYNTIFRYLRFQAIISKGVTIS